MKVALLGATGFVGTAILNEAHNRGRGVSLVGDEVTWTRMYGPS